MYFDTGITAPENLSVASSSVWIWIGWDNIQNVSAYGIYRSEYNGSEWGEYVALDENLGSYTTTYTDYDVEEGKKYKYRVRGKISEWGDYAVSEEISLTPRPEAPENITATMGADSIIITWSAVTGEKYYELHRCEYNGSEPHVIGF